MGLRIMQILPELRTISGLGRADATWTFEGIRVDYVQLGVAHSGVYWLFSLRWLTECEV